ncbi:MAG: hypothetical protein HY318_09995 [Armatimonadetes bacterium]|nr:hypothetical protein [Armatimonadota bacterium]
MNQSVAAPLLTFGQVLEAVEQLRLEEQESLLGVVRRRIVEHRRDDLASEIRLADDEFQAGRCRPASVGDLMQEILS